MSEGRSESSAPLGHLVAIRGPGNNGCAFISRKRNTLIAVALLSAASAQANQSILTYHGALDRAGRYVVPGLTYDRARGLRLDPSFHAAFQGKVYAQPLFW